MDENIRIFGRAAGERSSGCRIELEFYNVSTKRKTVQQNTLSKDELQEAIDNWNTDLNTVSKLEGLVCTAVRIYEAYEIVFDKYNDKFYNNGNE